MEIYLPEIALTAKQVEGHSLQFLSAMKQREMDTKVVRMVSGLKLPNVA